MAAPANVCAVPPPPPSIGALLIELLAFYGHVFDPKRHAVVGGLGPMGAPPPGCGFAERSALAPLLTSCTGRPPAAFDGADGSNGRDATPFEIHPLVCVDPVDATNNSAKSCYRIGLLQKLLANTAAAAVAAADEAAATAARGEDADPSRLLEALLGAGPQ